MEWQLFAFCLSANEFFFITTELQTQNNSYLFKKFTYSKLRFQINDVKLLFNYLYIRVMHISLKTFIKISRHWHFP